MFMDKPSEYVSTYYVSNVLFLQGRVDDAIRNEMRVLETNPYTCRKVSSNPFERELIIPFGGSGYVALFEIIGDDEVLVATLRHQREDDYY